MKMQIDQPRDSIAPFPIKNFFWIIRRFALRESPVTDDDLPADKFLVLCINLYILNYLLSSSFSPHLRSAASRRKASSEMLRICLPPPSSARKVLSCRISLANLSCSTK